MKENASIAWLMNIARGKRDMEMKKEELDEILEKHVMWLNKNGGERAVLRKADLRGANLCKADLSDADLRGANLRKADLSIADLSGANLCGANLENTNLYKVCLRGARLCNANLYRSCLHGADLRWINLREACLEGADLHETNLYQAELSGANLYGANLKEANLCEAKLRRVNLQEANLEWACLEGAILPIGIYQIVGAGSCNRCTTYDSINDRVICGCWSDGEGNHLNSFVKRIEEIYGAEGEEPNLEYHKEYMAAIAFFKAMKELKNG